LQVFYFVEPLINSITNKKLKEELEGKENPLRRMISIERLVGYITINLNVEKLAA